MDLMDFDTRKVRGPHERGFFGRQDVVELFFAIAHKDVLDPGRRAFRTVLLVEALARDAVRISNE